MDSRCRDVLLLLLLFASVTSAMSTEANDDLHLGFDISEDLSDVGIEAWNYVSPSLEPIAESLYETVTGIANTNVVPNIREHVQPSTQPVGADTMARLAGGVRPDTHTHHQFRYPSPSTAHQAPHAYPTLVGPFRSTAQQLPTVEQERVVNGQVWTNTPDTVTQQWVLNSYSTGARVVPSDSVLPSQGLSAHRPLYQQHRQDQLSSSMHTGQAGPPSLPRQRSDLLQDSTRTTSDTLSCDHPGCNYTSEQAAHLRHHRRCHIPIEDRRYPCPVCSRRFLFPREVQRHMQSHGLRNHSHYCPFQGCTHARRGFGRRDHLLRHISRVHTANTVRQASESVLPIRR